MSRSSGTPLNPKVIHDAIYPGSAIETKQGSCSSRHTTFSSSSITPDLFICQLVFVCLQFTTPQLIRILLTKLESNPDTNFP
mmetsp:Transcript_15215/g.17487  ORF Transcript_15215/g.17487 Transcript_15215/m.17487 type:complete len:82 (+) Transcript_15215:590-835(+)